MLIFFILFVFFTWVLLSIVIWSVYNGISPMPSSSKAKKCLLKHLPSQVEGKIYELGSGWGTLAFPLAAHNPNRHVIAIENSPFPLWVSRLRQLFHRQPNLTFLHKNFFDKDLSNAGLIVCYLYPGTMTKLKGKFDRELPSGTLVISNTFAIPGRKPIEVFDVEDLYKTKVYIYKW